MRNPRESPTSEKKGFPSSVKAVFFDLGETLVTQNIEDNMVTKRALREVVKTLPRGFRHVALYPIYQRGYRTNQQLRTRHNVEISIQVWMKQLLNRATGEDPSTALLDRAVGIIARHRGDNAVAFGDARSSVQKIKRHGLRLGVISNISSHEVALRILKHVGLQDYFDNVTTSALVGVRKPDPGIFRYALFQSRLTPQQAVHVGDSEAMDVEGARIAGLRTVLVSRKSSPATVADYRARSLKEVAQLLVRPDEDR